LRLITMNCPVRSLAESLIRLRSVTPDDAGCQTLIADRLRAIGFECEPMRFGKVDNLWAVRRGARPGPTPGARARRSHPDRFFGADLSRALCRVDRT